MVAPVKWSVLPDSWLGVGWGRETEPKADKAAGDANP